VHLAFICGFVKYVKPLHCTIATSNRPRHKTLEIMLAEQEQIAEKASRKAQQEKAAVAAVNFDFGTLAIFSTGCADRALHSELQVTSKVEELLETQASHGLS